MGDGAWGYNTHPGASLCIIPIPFEGTDPRNWIGRRTVMPMCSGASWQKFGAIKTVEETLAAKSVGSHPAEAGFGQHDDHRHTSGLLILDRFDSGLALAKRKLVRRACSRRFATCEKRNRKRKRAVWFLRRLSSLVVGQAGAVGAGGARGHSSALFCRVLWHDKTTNEERERRRSLGLIPDFSVVLFFV